MRAHVCGSSDGHMRVACCTERTKFGGSPSISTTKMLENDRESGKKHCTSKMRRDFAAITFLSRGRRSKIDLKSDLNLIDFGTAGTCAYNIKITSGEIGR